MMHSLPCMILRGGTSRGPFLRLDHLPADDEGRREVLRQVMGSGHVLQIDGLGGGNSLTSKVALVGPPSHPEADVDYLFAQVDVESDKVDFSPNCGNMLAAVGPYAIETGMIAPQGDLTRLRIHNLNTRTLIDSQVPTPAGAVAYQGDTRISGVPGAGSAIKLGFLGAVGAKTGKMLPSGQVIDVIDGVEVTCLDSATPVVLIEAASLGWAGNEAPAEMDANREAMARLEQIRLKAGELMGMGDVSGSVLPKPVILSAPRTQDGTLCARYFVPHRCHGALAVTGAITLAVATSIPGTLANRVALAAGTLAPDSLAANVHLEHPAGFLDVEVEHANADPMTPSRVSLLRTARKIMSGEVFLNLPDSVEMPGRA
ncbi:MAG: 4-oxalomesaconate tautomerase [Cobetia sp.]|uniref:4-oxalomesaconate tautomerase n=1 Tax=Cobetia sp. TaxID=1873876 RepID=UPI000C3A8365|nr:4-oxalomesaconate tautomerase [Cobetia sp.]MBF09429.1 4-oxalomesaconate tautomerase [Cobetia sp.]MBK09113.1 4-oxalomesaconate tautomerase [Cobetia sp.]